MLVADIVREFEKRESLSNLVFHGKVKGTVKAPKGFEELKLGRGNWAVLELYAITCLSEKYFSYTDKAALTPNSSVLFCLEDLSLIGKIVSVSGKKMSSGVALRKQTTDSRLGFHISLFEKKSNDWVIIPNSIELFKKSGNKEIDLLFKEYNSFEPYYLPITKSVLGFSCAKEWSYINKGNISKGSIQYTTDFSNSIKTDKIDSLKYLLYSSNSLYSEFRYNEPTFKDNLYLVKELLTKINKDSSMLNRLVPRTNKLVRDLIPKNPSSYKEFLSMVLGVSLEKDISDLILLNAPHYYYLVNKISFDDAEQIFYISNVISGGILDGCKYRGVSLISQGAVRTYKKLGHSMLLNSLVFPRICKMSETMVERFNETSSPLSKDLKGLLDLYYNTSSNDYVNLVDIYYYISNDEELLKQAHKWGIVVEPKLKYYALSKLVELEIDLAESLNDLSSTLFDYDVEHLQPSIDFVKRKYSYDFEQPQLRSFINLNTGFGMFLGTSSSGFNYIQEVIYLTAKNRNYFNKTIVIDVAYNKPKWVDDYSDIEFLPLDVIKYETQMAGTLDEQTLVLVNNAHRLTIDDYVSLVDYLYEGSALYLFGNPWSMGGVFNTLATKYSRSVVLPKGVNLSPRDLTLATVNGSLSFSKGKNLKVSSLPVATTISSICDMVTRTLKAGIAPCDVRVVSDLDKSLHFSKISDKLLNCYLQGEEIKENFNGLPVFLDSDYYELYKSGISLGVYLGSFVGVVISSSEGYSVVRLGNTEFTAKVPTSLLKVAICLESALAELYPVSVSFVVSQRNRGVLSKEQVVRSLDSARGISFVGSEEQLVNSYSELNRLPKTIIGDLM